MKAPSRSHRCSVKSDLRRFCLIALLLQFTSGWSIAFSKACAQPLGQAQSASTPQTYWFAEPLQGEPQESYSGSGIYASPAVALPDGPDRDLAENENFAEAQTPAPGQGTGYGTASGLPGLGFGGDRSPFHYEVLWIPAQDVARQPTDFEVMQQDIAFRYPLFAFESGMLTMTGGMEHSWFETGAILPNSGQPFPDKLWRIRAGTQLIRRFDNGWTGMLGTSIGSGTERPFEAIRDVFFTVTGVLSVPRNEHDAWNFFVFYAPTSEIPFPIPGASYSWNPSESLRVNIGAPTSVSYRPTERVTFEASYMLLRTVHAQATYEVRDRLSLYGAFDWSNESWFLSDRRNDEDKLFSYDKRMVAGIRSRFGDHLAVDVSTGYAFDRFYFTGENYDDRDHNRINVADGAFVALQGGRTW